MILMHRPKSARDRRHRRGQTLVEFALVIPIFLVILMGLLDFGRVIYAQHTINQDAAEGARVGAVSADTLTTSPDTFTARYAKIRSAAQLMAPAVPMNVLNDASASIKGAPSPCTGMPLDGTTGACFYPNGVNTTTPAKIVVNITVSVPLITPIISSIVGGSITVSATSEQLLQ